MLVLTRKQDQRIVIDENIVIHVLGIEGDRVRLGFEAPKAVKIHRFEIYEAIQRQQQGAESDESSGEL